MPIKKVLLYLSAVLLLSCGNRTAKEEQKAAGDVSAGTVETRTQKNEPVQADILRGWYEDSRFRLDVFSRFSIPPVITQDSSFYFKANMLRLTDKQNGNCTEATLADPCGFADQVKISLRTEELKWKQPLFQLDSPDCSDWWNSEFVAYDNDSLKVLFAVQDVAPVRLTRISPVVLGGHVRREEELVGAWGDYELHITLPDYAQKIIFPERQLLNYPTTVLDDIHGESASDSRERMTIRKGAHIIVDSIFRDQQKVRVRVNEGLSIDCSFDELEGKLQKSRAG